MARVDGYTLAPADSRLAIDVEKDWYDGLRAGFHDDCRVGLETKETERKEDDAGRNAARGMDRAIARRDNMMQLSVSGLQEGEVRMDLRTSLYYGRRTQVIRAPEFLSAFGPVHLP